MEQHNASQSDPSQESPAGRGSNSQTAEGSFIAQAAEGSTATVDVVQGNKTEIRDNQFHFHLLGTGATLVLVVGLVVVVMLNLPNRSNAPSAPELIAEPARTPLDQALYEGCTLLERGEIDAAEGQIKAARELEPQSAEAWYWQARVAVAKDNPAVALDYLETALKYNPEHASSLTLKIRLLLLQGFFDEAELAAVDIDRQDNAQELKSWIDCLNQEELFSSIVLTPGDLDACPYPAYSCEAIGGVIP